MEVNITPRVYPDTPEGRAVGLMNCIAGYFEDAEGAALYRAAVDGLVVAPALAEIGSFQGRSTVVLGSACRDLECGKVYAVDPHEGRLYREGKPTEPSLRFFLENVRRAGLSDWIFPVVRRSREAKLKEPVGLVFVDGLHDYESVREDIGIALSWLAPGGTLAFHDYCRADPGVMWAVDEFLAQGTHEKVSQVDRLLMVKKKAAGR